MTEWPPTPAISGEPDLYEGLNAIVTFVMMLVALPLFLVVFAMTLIFLAPFWLWVFITGRLRG